ncbi:MULTISPECIES: hypothetical protein [unclassified Nocardioides]|uniref:hypothetical protein n=1 Tax=unclassified Nocardioides TaxID=2615069 RepID=UPI0006F8ABD6|nr:MULTISPECIES: hypothetical protein [unclassified Nocardioides]KRA37930.1 hypothetical protein ASD81_04390 [Nocardioides sp. Root614]KRA91890.1 hypothetical protein ASD84_04655 [Nocardioides sp. Root682]
MPQAKRSRWLWWVYLGCGMMSFIGFVVVAVKVQNRKFAIGAGVSIVACLSGFAAYQLFPSDVTTSTNASTETSGDLSSHGAGVWIIMAIWIGLIVYGHVLDHDYKKFLRNEEDEKSLRWHSARAREHAIYAPVPAQSERALPHPSPQAPNVHTPTNPQIGALDAEVDRYLATQPLGNPPTAAPPNDHAV